LVTHESSVGATPYGPVALVIVATLVLAVLLAALLPGLGVIAAIAVV
jgi:hypothetical protein